MQPLSRTFAMLAALAVLLTPGRAQSYTAPAGERAAAKRLGAESILPGGRLITPAGRQHVTAAGPAGIAVSPSGGRIAVAGRSRGLPSVSVFSRSRPALRRERFELRERGAPAESAGDRQPEFRALAFEGENRLYLSERDTGAVRLADARNGTTIRRYFLDQGGYRGSDAWGLALDARRKRLLVVDRANSRLVVLDLRRERISGSAAVAASPSHIALSNSGDLAFILATGPPEDSPGGVVTVVDIAGAQPRVLKHIALAGRREPGGGGTGLGGVLAAGDEVYVTSRGDDRIHVIDPVKLEATGEMPLRIAGLETLPGIAPAGMAFDAARQRLYVAESGIDAVAVVDTARRRLLGHLPAGWRPGALALHGSDLYVANENGQGTGPNATMETALPPSATADLEQGTLSEMVVATDADLDRQTARVMANNGFVASAAPASPLPDALRYIVLILKGNRSFDEIFGDLRMAANGPVDGAPALARFGNLGFARQERGGLTRRGALEDVPVTPNHRSLADQFAFSDNFYRGLGGRPDSESQAAWELALGRHLRKHGVAFLDFDAPSADASTGAGSEASLRREEFALSRAATDTPDQLRAERFLGEIETRYRNPLRDLPRLILLRLPNDRTAPPRPDDGYPFRASYVADNDVALGKVVEYLSRSPWWKEMAVLVMEEESGAGLDHVDAHRSLLLVASPYARTNYVSRRNTGFASVVKTVLRVLRVPPMGLADAAAADLSDCFSDTPRFEPYLSREVTRDLFDPQKARER